MPASKGTHPGGDGPAWRDVTGPHGRQVAEALAIAAGDLDDGAFARLTESPASQVPFVRPVDRAVVDAPTLPAWQRYNGVVHTAADPQSLAPDARKRFRRHVGYVSALAGLVMANEPLPEYRLPMGANLHGVGPLAAFWRDRIETRLGDIMAPGGRVWLLTGGEYERAIQLPVGVRSVDVRFVEQRNNRPMSPPSAAVKQARGIIARNLALTAGAGRDPEALVWHGVRFVAGLRNFELDHADADGQTWRATPQ